MMAESTGRKEEPSEGEGEVGGWCLLEGRWC